MPTMVHVPRQARVLLVLGICVLILSALPARSAQAALIPQSVDNTLAEFTSGTFQRTSLGAQKVWPAPDPQPRVADEVGAVQLVPIGLLKNWVRLSSAFDLPKKLTSIAAVTIGTHIFVIGGLTPSGNTLQYTNEVWSTTIDPATGAPLEIPGQPQKYWYDEPDLPAVQITDSEGLTTPTAPRAEIAVAAVQTDPDSGYIYVIGGETRPTGAADAISSYAVNIARVVNGHIDVSYAPTTNGWRTGPRIPDINPLLGGIGVESASALSYTVGGKTFVYLLGGKLRYLEGFNVVEAASNKVFYAQVAADGRLVKPSAPGTEGWDPLAPIPVANPDTMGVWDATTVTSHIEPTPGNPGGDVLFLIGGQLQPNPPLYSSQVFRALINSDGTLAWQNDSPALTLPEARISHAGVQFNDNLYITGGRPNGATDPPQAAILTSSVMDDLRLSDIGTGGSNFLSNPSALPVPRTNHGSVVVPATPRPGETHAAAYVYVIAGQGRDDDAEPGDEQGSSTLIYGRIGGSEATNETGFAPNGWYYSQPHSTIFDGTKLQQINWTTVITRGAGMDIQMEYRVAVPPDRNCNSANTFASAEWRPIDGSPGDEFFSVNSGNSFTLVDKPLATCFQYRAKLISPGDSTLGGAARETPSLLNVSILVEVPGGPDLTVNEVKDIRSVDGKGRLTGLSVKILNHNSTPGNPTLPADVEGQGSFFVDLFVFRSSEQVIIPSVPLSEADKQRSKAYANISKSAMGIDTLLPITQWCDANPAIKGCQPINLLSLFATPDTYTVIVVVDSFGYVNEIPEDPAERNNVSAPFQIVVTAEAGIGYDVMLPIVRR